MTDCLVGDSAANVVNGYRRGKSEESDVVLAPPKAMTRDTNPSSFSPFTPSPSVTFTRANKAAETMQPRSQKHRPEGGKGRGRTRPCMETKGTPQTFHPHSPVCTLPPLTSLARISWGITPTPHHTPYPPLPGCLTFCPNDILSETNILDANISWISSDSGSFSNGNILDAG